MASREVAEVGEAASVQGPASASPLRSPTAVSTDGSPQTKCENDASECCGLPLGEHKTTCEHASVRCEACDELIKKRDVEEHQREKCRNRLTRCPRCSEEGTYAEIVGLDAPFTRRHRCAKALVSCPNHCKKSRKIERGQLAAHLKACPLQSMDCEFRLVGCEARLTRRSLTQHMRDHQQQHLLMLLGSVHSKMSLLQREVEFLMQNVQDPTIHASLACMSCHVSMGRLSLDGVGDKVTFRLTNYRHLSLCSGEDGKWESPSFYFASKYRMELVVYPGGVGAFLAQSLSVYLRVSKPEGVGAGSDANQDIGWPMDCAYVALQVSVLPQVLHSSQSDQSHAQPLMPKPVSFTAHVCHFCRQQHGYQTIPEDKDHTTAEVARNEDFVHSESLTEAGLLFQDSIVLRIEQTVCECA